MKDDEYRARCPVCSSHRVDFICHLPFAPRRTPSSHASPPNDTDVYRCRECGSYWRDGLDGVDLTSHFTNASYTNLAREETLRARRLTFLEFLVQLGLRQVSGKKTPQVLDVGCSYGHLLEYCHQRGCTAWGVEPVDALRERMNASAVAVVFADLKDVPGELKFDLVFLIDSLYCFRRPTEILSALAGMLDAEGSLIIRIANRTPLLSLRVGLKRPISPALFGDELVALSHRGMKRATATAGLRVERILHFEHKSMRGRSWRLRLMYWFLPVVARGTGLRVSPGLIYVCTKIEGRGYGDETSHSRLSTSSGSARTDWSVNS
jgi:SAM-dependent methyltransferase